MAPLLAILASVPIQSISSGLATITIPSVPVATATVECGPPLLMPTLPPIAWVMPLIRSRQTILTTNGTALRLDVSMMVTP